MRLILNPREDIEVLSRVFILKDKLTFLSFRPDNFLFSKTFKEHAPLFTFLAVILSTISFALSLWTSISINASPPLFEVTGRVQYSLGL